MKNEKKTAVKKETEKKEAEPKTVSTEIVFILDKSGSMSGLESDTIGGFNSMLSKQKEEKGDAFVTTVLFDTAIKTLHDRIPLSDVPEMSGRDYLPGGCTALLDAIGQTLCRIKDIHRYIRKEDVPEKTIFIITTDGLENASREFTAEKVKALIEEQKKLGWEFLFLGANIDAVSTAKQFGIAEDRAVTYTCDKVGTALNFKAMGGAIKAMRCSAPLTEEWKEEIEEDHKNRKKNKD